MSNSAPVTPRQEPSAVTSHNFYYCFIQALARKGPGAMFLALQKITRLEAQNRILLKKIEDQTRRQILYEIAATDRMGKLEEELSSVKFRGKATQHAGITAKITTEVKLSSLETKTDAIKKENLELKSAHKVLEDSVLEIQGIAKWKIDLERYEKLKWELDRSVQALQNYQNDVQSMKKQKFKIQSKVSQLENTITRQAESMRLDLKDIKKQKKKLQKEKEGLSSVKEAKVFAARSLTNFTSTKEDFGSDPRVLENCQIYGLTISEVPRPDYIPPKFEVLRGIWGTLSHFDYKHCLRVLSNYGFRRLRLKSTMVP